VPNQRSPNKARTHVKPTPKAPKARKKRRSAGLPVTLFRLFPEYRKTEYLKRVADQREEALGQLRESYMHQGLVLYLGAGVSRSLGVPNWSELIRSLTVGMMTRKVRSAIDALGGLTEKKQWEAVLTIQEELERQEDYDKPILMMARAIKDELGDELPRQVARNLYRRIPLWRYAVYSMRKSFPRRGMPPRPHSSPLVDAIVALARAERDVKGVQAIMNYNYDSLVDRKLAAQNVRCITVTSGRDKVPPGALPCYHVHGVLRLEDIAKANAFRKPSIGNFVFSEDEYHSEYSDPYKWSNMTQISLLGRFSGLFVGLSMEDPNIRRLIDVTHRQYPEISNYAVLVRKKSLSRSPDSKQTLLRNLFEGVETSSFGKIGVKIIWLDRYEDIPPLLRSICTAREADLGR
jgi:hypothetical protein